jgi:antitoxin YefM
MTTLSYTHTRNNLAKVLEQAEENHEAIIVTRSGKNPSVIMSMEEFESLQETLHLLSSPQNALRMQKSLADYEAGNFVNGDLIETN